MAGRVLIVDDAACMREGLAEILQAAGLEVVDAVADGLEAVKSFERLRPDLVTMDLILPGCSGLEALAKILKIDPEARVLLTSCRGQETLVMQAMQAGAQDWVVKPFQPQCVVSAVRKLMDGEADILQLVAESH